MRIRNAPVLSHCSAMIARCAAADAAKAEEAYLRVEKSCTDCHKQFRDTPKGAASR